MRQAPCSANLANTAKCDEQKPACTNCEKRDIKCEYENESDQPRLGEPSPSHHSAEAASSGSLCLPAATSSRSVEVANSAPSLAQSSLPATFDLIDLELLHTWENSTAPSIARFVSSADSVSAFWKVMIPEVGLSYPFVLHATLALSAIHLSRFKPDRGELRSKAEQHWNHAFFLATSQVSKVNHESHTAFYIFSKLSCIYKLAKGPAPRDYLFFGEASEWLTYRKGFRSFLELGLNTMQNGALADYFDVTFRKVDVFARPNELVDPEPIAALRKLCDDRLGLHHPKYETYKVAVDDLSRCYIGLYRTQKHDSDTRGLSSIIFIWIMRLSDGFISCMQQEDPVALTILAYYVVLLDEMSGFWVLSGWTYHLISGIYEALPDPAKTYIRWPMEQTGWIPP